MTERHRQWIGRIGHALSAVLRRDGGMSAIEFSVFAPLLAVSVLATVDIGLATRQRMAMDHVLRSGVQSAMADPGIAGVLRTLETTASANFTVGGTTAVGGKPPVSLNGERYCTCPESPTVRVPCTTICTGNKPTLAFYRLWASGTYSGALFTSISLNPEVEVQVR